MCVYVPLLLLSSFSFFFSFLSHIFTVINEESDGGYIARLDMFTRDTAGAICGFGKRATSSPRLKNCKNSTSYPVLSLSRYFLILDVSSTLKSPTFNPSQSLQDLTPIRSYAHSCSHSYSSRALFPRYKR